MLTAGTTLAHYTILGPLGAGAMGEVYRAKDSKLGREVAIKVLPEHFAADEERLKRFEREAKTLASLNHPNVAQIHGVDQVGDTCFLVLELVPGESLEERLKRGPLPVEEALDVCRQIAEGLEAAHEAGVIHRDLKPANVRITPEGKVKVLDFGLAKPASESHHGSSTDSVLSTESGRLLGTPTYMAPEQARGKAIDRRVDIWAFGCVLYECLTAKRAFAGESLTDVLGAVLHTTPDLARLPSTTPQRVRELLARCFDKDPHQRLRDIGEARWRLDPHHSEQAPGAEVRRGVSPSWRITAAVLFVAVVALGVIAALHGGRGDSPHEGRVVRSVMELPPDTVVGFQLLSLSHDGSRLVLTGFRDGKFGLLQRPLGTLESHWIPGAETGSRPFLSRDGNWVGFTARNKLSIVPTEGGPTQDLVEGSWGGGDWTKDGALIYTPDYQSGLWSVPVTGGTARMLTAPDSTRAELAHWWPQVLPDDEHVLFTAFSTPIERARIEVLSRKSGQRKVLVEGAFMARYVPSGHLLFVRKDALYAAPFDLERLELKGTPVPVVEGIAIDVSDGCAGYAVSDEGTLIYLPAAEYSVHSELVWVSRKGEPLGVAAPAGIYDGPALSSDGRWLAMSVMVPPEASDVVLLDLVRGTKTFLTSGGASDFGPVFTPSGKQVVYVSERPIFDLYVRNTDGGTPSTPLVVTKYDKNPGSITPDGKTVLFQHSILPHAQIWTAALDGQGDPSPLIVSDSGDLGPPALSPDGRWLAFEQQDTGQSQIYMVPYPDVKQGRRAVSTSGGDQPMWTRGGAELVYREGKKMLAVSVDPATGDLGEPQLLFEADYMGRSGRRGYAVTPDGERFLMLKRISAGARRVVVVANWFTELRQKVPR